LAEEGVRFCIFCVIFKEYKRHQLSQKMNSECTVCDMGLISKHTLTNLR